MITQQIINVIVIASGYLLVGISFSIILRAGYFLNMSYAVPYTVAPYVTFYFIKGYNLTLLFAAFLGLLFSGLVGLVLEKFIFQPLKNKQASPLVCLLTSLGIYVIFINVISLLFGDNPYLLQPVKTTESIEVFGANIVMPQICLVTAAVAVTTITFLGSRLTNIGLAFNAAADAPELASVSGIDTKQLMVQASVFGSILAGLSGTLSANYTNIHPSIGLQALFIGIIVVIIGGKQSIIGIIFASLLVSVAQSMGVWRFSSLWQDAIAFVILLLFLLIKPEGFFGKKIIKATI